MLRMVEEWKNILLRYRRDEFDSLLRDKLLLSSDVGRSLTWEEYFLLRCGVFVREEY